MSFLTPDQPDIQPLPKPVTAADSNVKAQKERAKQRILAKQNAGSNIIAGDLGTPPNVNQPKLGG